MKKNNATYLLALSASLALGLAFAGCNQSAAPASQPTEKTVEKNTTIINPPENDTTVVNPPPVVEKKVENNTTIVNRSDVEKKVENNTTVVNRPEAEKKVENNTTVVKLPVDEKKIEKKDESKPAGTPQGQ